MIKHCLGNSQINSEFFYNISFPAEQTQKFTRTTSTSRYILFIHSPKLKKFSTLEKTLFHYRIPQKNIEEP